MAIEKFVDSLPIPSVMKPKSHKNDIPYYEVDMRQVKQKLHRDLPPTTVWGYDGEYPGPTIEATMNKPVYVKWKNNLPFRHLFPVDRTLHGAHPDQPSVRTVVHLHGGRVSPENDGYPEAWFTKDFCNVGSKFAHDTYYYPNCQRPATLWYHDHALGITRLNVYAGLAGFYLLRDQEEKALNLPSGCYEIPMVIQDRSFRTNENNKYTGELFYPQQPDPADITTDPFPNPSVVPEFFGDTILVNGKVWPYLKVEPRKYRFRLLNGSNSRFYRMRLSNGQTFTIIGTDGGLLESPVRNLEELILAPGERADIIIDFSGNEKQDIILTNDAATPFPGDPLPPEDPTTEIMQFRVTSKLSKPDTSEIPDNLGCFERLTEDQAIQIRENTLNEGADSFGRLILLLNNKEWNDEPILNTPKSGTVEIWELYNLTPDTHPIHLHLVQFQILDRAPFTTDENGNLVRDEANVVLPPLEERGWKDIVRANPDEVTRIIARFGPFTGVYPWHCHILEHEDHEMMRPYEVLDNHGFDPCEPIEGVCPDDQFSQCCYNPKCKHRKKCKKCRSKKK